MKLTRQQKYFIKKNYRRLDFDQIANELRINPAGVEKYLKKKLSNEKFKKILKKMPALQKRNPIESGDSIRQNRFYIFILIGLVFAVYVNSLGNGFVSDDIGAIAKNENIGKFGAIFKSFFGSFQTFIHFLIYNLFGLNPTPYRLANIFLHIGSVTLVFSILAALHKKRIAFIAALLFAVHPLLTESITWISGMPYALYSFLFLLSFYFYLMANKDKKFYFLSLFSFFLAIVSSEKAVPLFLVFVLYEWIFNHNQKFWKKTLPFFAISLTLGIIFAGEFGKRISSLETSSYQSGEQAFSPLAQIPVAISQYLKLLVWPNDLTLYHTEMNFSSLAFLFMTIVALLVFATLVYSFWKNRLIFFWLSFFFIALSVTLAPLGVAWIVAERYAYLSALGFFVIFAIGIDQLFIWLKNKGWFFEKIFFSLVGLIILLLATRTAVRNNDWKNEDSLWFATAKVSPSGWQIYNNLGDVYGRRGDYEKAIEQFKKAVEINPNYADAWHNLANTYQQAGQSDLAIEDYQKAVEKNPALWQSYQSLAVIYFEKGENEKSLENVKKALEINPENQELLNMEKIILEK